MFKDDDALIPKDTPPEDMPSGQPAGIEVHSTKSDEPVVVIPSSEGTAERAGSSRVQITFMGNSYDLTAVVAVVTGGVIAFSCLTCNMGYYCLPVIPVVLGVVGLISAEDSADPKRTRLLSWIGIGSGGVVLLLIILAIVLYVAFIALAIVLGAAAEAQ